MKKVALIFFVLVLSSLGTRAQEKDVWSVELGSWGDSVMASAGYGYNCFDGFYLGAGLGLTWNFSYPVSYPSGGSIGKTYYSRVLVPIYADMKYYFVQKKVSPFVDLKGGFLSDYTHKDVGFFVRPAIGLEMKKIGVNLGFEYNNLKGSPMDQGDTMMRGYVGVSYRF